MPLGAQEYPSDGGTVVRPNRINWKLSPGSSLNLNVTVAAKVLGVAGRTLSRVLNGHAAVSPETAIRLEKAGWSTADFWLRLQAAYDLVQARRNQDQIRVERYRPRPAA